MAIVSIKNKTKSGSLLVGNTGFDPGGFESIQTVTVGTATTNIQFTSIPATYTHLQVRFSASILSANNAQMPVQLNGDTGANYISHYFIGRGSGAILAGGLSAYPNAMYMAYWQPVSGSYSNPPLVGIMDILDYANTSKYKTLRSLAGNDHNSTYNAIGLQSGLWMSTTAITSIKMTCPDASNWGVGSSFALYGIKAA